MPGEALCWGGLGGALRELCRKGGRVTLRVEQAVRVGVAERAAHRSGPAWTRAWGQGQEGAPAGYGAVGECTVCRLNLDYFASFKSNVKV